jgi:lipopolysaccharide transport system permease protein
MTTVAAREQVRDAELPGPAGTAVLEPSNGRARFNLRELWEYRELLYFLVWRDVKVRYTQTVLGVAWAVLQPLLTMLVFTVVFDRLAGIRSDGVPYPVFAFAALLPWQLFAHCLTQSSGSIVANQHLITRVYFPRLFIPVASVLGGLVDFGVAFVVLLLLMGYYGIVPGPALTTVPLFVLFAVAVGLSVGLWLSALNAQYRDVRYAIPFLTQFWLWATPIAYPVSLVPMPWRVLCGLNPMAGVVEGFRWALLGTGTPPGPLVLVSALVVAAALLSGLFYFRRMEATFADVV